MRDWGDAIGNLSRYRFDGEPVPDDLRLLIPHANTLLESTLFSLNWDREWAPWADRSYLSEKNRADPSIMANCKAIDDVCKLIVFVAQSEDHEYLGYWRGPNKRPIAASPIISLSNEGRFELVPGRNIAEALLFTCSGHRHSFDELKSWFASLGISTSARLQFDFPTPVDDVDPSGLHDSLFYKYCGK